MPHSCPVVGNQHQMQSSHPLSRICGPTKIKSEKIWLRPFLLTFLWAFSNSHSIKNGQVKQNIAEKTVHLHHSPSPTSSKIKRNALCDIISILRWSVWEMNHWPAEIDFPVLADVTMCCRTFRSVPFHHSKMGSIDKWPNDVFNLGWMLGVHSLGQNSIDIACPSKRSSSSVKSCVNLNRSPFNALWIGSIPRWSTCVCVCLCVKKALSA